MSRRMLIQGVTFLKHVPFLKKYIHLEEKNPNFHVLCVGGAANLPDWSEGSNKAFSIVSGLANRPYTPEEVKAALRYLGQYAPSLTIHAHLGNDRDKIGCIATVRLRNRIAEILPPMMDKRPEPTELPADFDLVDLFFPV